MPVGAPWLVLPLRFSNVFPCEIRHETLLPDEKPENGDRADQHQWKADLQSDQPPVWANPGRPARETSAAAKIQDS